MTYVPCNFDRDDYLFDDVFEPEAASVLCEFNEDIDDLAIELEHTRYQLAKAEKRKNACQILTCVYCSHEYLQDTLTHGVDVLTSHIKVCEKHPMRKAEANIATLRSALIGLVGSGDEEILRQMETMVRALPAPESDKIVSVNAIHALLATVPKEI